MKNNIYSISESEVSEKVKQLINENIFIAELHGKDIQSNTDYLSAVWKAFQMPEDEEPHWPGHDDWIRDLDWLNSSGYAVFISDYDEFLKKDRDAKEYVMKSYRDVILPFWEDEVEKVVMGGVAKSFQVYLIK